MRKLIKVVLNIKLREEWKSSIAMQSFKEDSELRHHWLRFWKQNKQRTGVKCKSLEASGRMAFRLKCLSNEVLVLTVP